jgi:uncharacterized integral membrane protein
MRFLFFLGVLLLAAATIFALQNPMAVPLRFLVWNLSTTLALAVIGAAVAGGLLVYVASLLSLGDLRRRLRAAEGRLREVERDRSARGEPPQPPRS